MDIAEEMRNIHLQILQDEWDKWLLKGWQKHNTMTGYSINAFMKKHKIEYTTFNKLKRVPRCKTQNFTRLTRFIAAYLPQLNNLLWADKYSDEQILNAMKGIDTQMNPADAGKVNRETRERNKARQEAHAEIVSHGLVKDQRAYTAKSNWGHCK